MPEGSVERVHDEFLQVVDIGAAGVPVRSVSFQAGAALPSEVRFRPREPELHADSECLTQWFGWAVLECLQEKAFFGYGAWVYLDAVGASAVCAVAFECLGGAWYQEFIVHGPLPCFVVCLGRRPSLRISGRCRAC